VGPNSPDGAWHGRPLLAGVIRLVQYGVPLLVGWLTAHAVRAVLSPHLPSLWLAVAVVVVAVVTSLVTSRLTIRLAPLALLLRMTMVFPDKAPSRFKVARRSTSATEIRRLLDSADATAHEAAVTMLSLVTALGHHDKHTRGHSERVRVLCDMLSAQLGLPEPDRARLRWAALIHDVGKLEVSAAILNKPGTLDNSEWQVVREHPATGARLARPLAEWLGPWFPGIMQHHERYDGTGYPLGLAADQITLAGRAVAVVDAFETMTSARAYQAARTVVAARAELTRCAGTHFDPAIVRSFLEIALPRLLWAVGPLAFVVNAPFVRWIGDGGARIVDLTGVTAQAAVNAAGVTAVVVTSGAAATSVSTTAPPAPAQQRVVRSDQPVDDRGAQDAVRPVPQALASATSVRTPTPAVVVPRPQPQPHPRPQLTARGTRPTAPGQQAEGQGTSEQGRVQQGPSSTGSPESAQPEPEAVQRATTQDPGPSGR
jgi:hypothetical protein